MKKVRVKRMQESSVEMIERVPHLTLGHLRELVRAADNFGLSDQAVVLVNDLALNGVSFRAVDRTDAP